MRPQSVISSAKDPRVSGETAAGLETLLAQLRHRVPPAAPPSVVVTRRNRYVDVYLEVDRLVEEVALSGESGATTVIGQHETPLNWRTPTVTEATVAEAQLGGVRVILERRNDAVLVKAGNKEWLALLDGQSPESN